MNYEISMGKHQIDNYHLGNLSQPISDVETLKAEIKQSEKEHEELIAENKRLTETVKALMRTVNELLKSIDVDAETEDEDYIAAMELLKEIEE